MDAQQGIRLGGVRIEIFVSLRKSHIVELALARVFLHHLQAFGIAVSVRLNFHLTALGTLCVR